MQALDGYKVSPPIPRVKMEVHSPISVPKSLSAVDLFSEPTPVSSSSPSFYSSPRFKVKQEHITPLKMDPYGYEHDSWNSFIYDTEAAESQQFFVQDNMNEPQPYTIFPTPYGVSQGNSSQVGMVSHQQWNMNNPQPQGRLQYPQTYYPTTPSVPGQPIPQMPGPNYMAGPTHQQHQSWPQTAHANHSTHSSGHVQHIPSPPSSQTVYAPIVPSSNSSGGNESSDGDHPSSSNSTPSLTARYSTAVSWLNRTSSQLTPAQIHIARYIISSSWWETESAEPELRADDELVVKGLISPGGSRFRAFLDEERGWKCTFDHDGVVCQHGKGRMERALGTIRGFFVYKPVTCGGGCGSRCAQRFVSVEQCQKHVQKKRSGRVACPECGSSILPANMSRHRRACHAM